MEVIDLILFTVHLSHISCCQLSRPHLVLAMHQRFVYIDILSAIKPTIISICLSDTVTTVRHTLLHDARIVMTAKCVSYVGITTASSSASAWASATTATS